MCVRVSVCVTSVSWGFSCGLVVPCNVLGVVHCMEGIGEDNSGLN